MVRTIDGLMTDGQTENQTMTNERTCKQTNDRCGKRDENTNKQVRVNREICDFIFINSDKKDVLKDQGNELMLSDEFFHAHVIARDADFGI